MPKPLTPEDREALAADALDALRAWHARYATTPHAQALASHVDRAIRRWRQSLRRQWANEQAKRRDGAPATPTAQTAVQLNPTFFRPGAIRR